MNIQQSSEPELQILLTQLARFFKENETVLSAEQISESFGHLSAIEVSALDRLFNLLYQSKVSALYKSFQILFSHFNSLHDKQIPDFSTSAKRGGSLRLDGTSIDFSGRQNDGPSMFRTVSQQNGLSVRSIEGRSSQPSHVQEHQTVVTSQPTYNRQPGVHATSCSDHTATRTQINLNHQSSSFLTLGQNTALSPPPSPDGAATLVTPGAVAAYQEEPIALSGAADDFTFGKVGLSTCSGIKLTPSTRQLLEKCKTNRGEFLRAIKDARAAFPTGQGWEAAIATKQENADIRDLMRIYHRFECYNIYTHVVEAGFHTGAHWIRDMRAVLVKRLSDEFPDRFCDGKTANRCLNWVDQGCRYHEWTKMFSGIPDLGYLIALPSEISHSAYVFLSSPQQPRLMNT
jgi:hypothetical protein